MTANQFCSLVDLKKGGDVFEDSSGTVIAVIVQASELTIWAHIDGTENEDDADTASTVFGGGVIGFVAAAIDANDVIHVVAACTSEQTRDIAYCTATESGGVYSFGTWEEVASYTESAPSYPGVSISIDSNSKPHVLFVDAVKVSGSTQDNVYYSNKTGASWASPTQIGIRNTKTDTYRLPRLTHRGSNQMAAGYFGIISSSNYFVKRVYTSSTWGSETTYASSSASTVADVDVVCNAYNTSYTYGSDNGNIDEDGTDTNSNNDANTPLRAAISGSPATIRNVFIVGYSDKYIRRLYNSGAGWSNEPLQTAGIYNAVICDWSFYHLNATGIHYIFSTTSNNAYHDEYGGVSYVNFSAAGLLASSTPSVDLNVLRAMTAAGLASSSTPSVALNVLRTLTAAGLLASSTPDDVELGIIVLLAAAGLLASATPDVVELNVLRALTAAGLVDSSTSAAELAVLRAMAAAGLVDSSTSTASLNVLRELTAAGLIDSSTSTASLNVLRAISAAGLLASSTPDDVDLDIAALVLFAAAGLLASSTPDTAELNVIRALQAAGLIDSSASTVELNVLRAMTAAGLLASSTPDDVELSIVVILAAAGLLASSTSTAELNVIRALQAAGLMASSTPDDVALNVIRALQAAGLLASATPDDVVLDLAGIVEFMASGLLSSSTSTPALNVLRAMQAAGLASSSTPDDVALAVLRELQAAGLLASATPDDVDLIISAVVLFAAAGLLASATPDDAALAILRELQGAGQIQSSTSTVNLAVLRELVASGQIQSSTSSAVLNVLRELQATGQLASSAPDDVVLALVVCVGLLSIIWAGRRPGATVQADQPGGTESGRRPGAATGGRQGDAAWVGRQPSGTSAGNT